MTTTTRYNVKCTAAMYTGGTLLYELTERHVEHVHRDEEW